MKFYRIVICRIQTLLYLNFEKRVRFASLKMLNKGNDISSTFFLSSINRCNSGIATGGLYLAQLSRLFTWSNLPFSECRLLWSGQIQNLTIKHWNYSWHSWPVSCQFLHTQQSHMYASQHLHLKARIPYCWVYQSHYVIIVPQFPCLKDDKCERQRFNVLIS